MTTNSSQSLLRGAVVGVGYLGTFHAQKMKVNPAINFVGVCDFHFPQAQKVAADLKVKAFEKASDLLGQVDLVTIAASTQSHYELAKLFLENGIHVNVEKPITATLPQAKEIVELAKKKNLVLCVGHIERFNPSVLEAMKFTKDWSLIELTRHAPFKPRGADVSVLHDLMIHDVDMAFLLAGTDVQSILATGQIIHTKELDVADVVFTYPKNRLLRISVNRMAVQAKREIRIVAKSGVLVVNSGTHEFEWTNGAEIKKWTLEKQDALALETDAFIQAVYGKVNPVVTGQDGLVALTMIEKINQIIISGVV